jgi:uncharacterized ParB-like nuclease family protein
MRISKARVEEVAGKRVTVHIPIRLIEPWRCQSPKKWRAYAKMTRADDEFPPIEVIRQSSKLHGYPYRLFDGYHRTRAAKHIGRRTIVACCVATD